MRMIFGFRVRSASRTRVLQLRPHLRQPISTVNSMFPNEDFLSAVFPIYCTGLDKITKGGVKMEIPETLVRKSEEMY